ncbi:OmpW family outer membrane protein [Ralstonia pseudosolanacearum]|uniref:OmpW family outer membrane protein n=1 Tax=Ralstonia pseudosolanacearum TaxID=1310165 RepID=UPI000ABB6326
MSAETSSSWTPTATVGVSYEFARNWFAIGTVSYLPLKTTSTITIRSQQGQVLATNKTDIKVDPVVFGLNLGYKFRAPAAPPRRRHLRVAFFIGRRPDIMAGFCQRPSPPRHP